MSSDARTDARTREQLHSVAVFTVTTGALLFLAMAISVQLQLSTRFDESLVRMINPSASLGKLQEIARDVTALGGYTVLTLVVVSVCLFLKATGRGATMYYLITTVVGGYLLMTVLKSSFGRPRPAGVLHLSYVESSSFPSGHSMMSTVVYCTVGLLLADLTRHARLRRHLLVVPALLTFAVGLSRIYLGVHYPTDVIAGWSAGILWSSGAWLIARRLESLQIIPPVLLESSIEADAA